MDMHPDVQQAIRLVKKGYINSYATVVKKYTPTILRYIKAKLFKKEETDDLVQNVFISFYKAIHRFDENKPVLPYLYQIAKNELKMYYRSHKETIALNEAVEIPALHSEEKKEDYADVFDTMNHEQKNIFLLLQDGYSYKEIANKMSKPINTIRTIIHRTRLQVRKNYYEKT